METTFKQQQLEKHLDNQAEKVLGREDAFVFHP